MKAISKCIWLCCLLNMMLLQGCLTRKNALPPDQVPSAQRQGLPNQKVKKTARNTQPKRKASKNEGNGSMQSDASDKKGFQVDPNVPLHEQYASWMGITSRDIKKPELYPAIHQWMGVPHKDGGNSRSGIDCSGFVQHIFKEIYGIQTPRSSQDMAQAVSSQGNRSLKEGDLVFFSFGKKKIDHVGIYLHQHKFVHVSTSKGVIISDMRDPWYASYFVKSGSFQ
jgi:lipoprotein Spr